MAFKNFRKSSGKEKAFKRANGVEDATSKFQDNVAEKFSTLEKNPIMNGVPVKQVALVAGSVNSINHKLGREPQGYYVTKKNGSSDIWDSQESNKLKDLTLDLNCSANVTVDLWIF